MCKLFAVVEIENQRNAELFAKKAVPVITRIDNHGLGIMRLGERGVHIQRWLEPPTVYRSKQSKALFKYREALRHQQNEEGTKSHKLYALAIHGRFATCEKSLRNTHPFYKDGAALMHNGIISNASQYPRTLSTCDSEALLTQYLEKNVRKNPHNLTDALDGVGGYYAAIVFNDNGVIDIWRDDTATLFLAHVRGVGVVIATTKEIITTAARRCKAYISGIDEILPGVALRWINGINPRLTKFEIKKPIALLPNGARFEADVIEEHKSSVSDADHWWNEADKGADIDLIDDKEARRVAKWKAEEEADQKRLRQICGIEKGV